MRSRYTDFHNGCMICNSHKQLAKVLFLQNLFNICCHLFSFLKIILLLLLLLQFCCHHCFLRQCLSMNHWLYGNLDLLTMPGCQLFSWRIPFWLGWVRWNIRILQCISLRAKNVEYILKYLSTICVSLSENSLFHFLAF